MQVNLYGRDIDLGENPSKLMVKRWTGEYSPEPETVAWIGSLEPGRSFFDIGASVGTHAIRAAVRGLRVTAFEPHESSFNDLKHTVELNKLSVVCEWMALFDQVARGALVRGRSKYTFAPYATPSPGGHVTAISLDQYCKLSRSMPRYIKLDVDGNEVQILRGGEQVLREHVQEALIEVDPVINPEIPRLMQDFGFRYAQKQVDTCIIKEGKYKGTANYIFSK